nr:hypothetical protein [Microbacterium hydrocarbonoxydans]
MTRMSSVAAWTAAIGLLLAGVMGFFTTHATWSVCSGDQTTERCLRTMDQPGHLASLQVLWIGALALCILALVVARGRAARALAAVAGILVLVMNYPTEYILWLGFAGGHWDVAPGTGYTQSLAFALAGVLAAAAAVLSTRAGAARVADGAVPRELVG